MNEPKRVWEERKWCVFDRGERDGLEKKTDVRDERKKDEGKDQSE